MLKLISWAVVGLFRSRASLKAENLTLHHQLNVLQQISLKRVTFSNFDRGIFATLYRIAPRIVDVLAIVEPETVVRCHRAAFDCSGDGNRDVAAAGQEFPSKFAS